VAPVEALETQAKRLGTNRAAPGYAKATLPHHELFEGAPDRAECRLVLDQDTAWRLFFKALTADAARERVTIDGSAALAEPALRTLAIMA
jgi:hypothetical protein